MKSLYDYAYDDYRFSLINFELLKEQNDEMFINRIAYFLEQAVEKLLKYLIEQTGNSYPKTHDIETLIQMATKCHINVPELILDNGDTLTNWCTKTRYNTNYLASVRKIEQLVPVIGTWFEETQLKQVVPGKAYTVEEWIEE